MVNKIDKRLQEVSRQGRPALMAHAVVGYPTLAATKELVQKMEKAGVDLVELQIPFSDPLADGPTIQRACEYALARGTKVADSFAVARELSQTTVLPLLFMTYYNIVYKYGVEKFCADAAKAGISGLIIPDAPLESAEYEGLMASCKKHSLHNILTLAPTSTTARIKKNAQAASGFIYCMSRQGITGVQAGFDPLLQKYLGQVRDHTKTPLAVGFGVSGVERFRAVAPHADIVVVGSAVIDRLARGVGSALSLISELAKEARSQT